MPTSPDIVTPRPGFPPTLRHIATPPADVATSRRYFAPISDYIATMPRDAMIAWLQLAPASPHFVPQFRDIVMPWTSFITLSRYGVTNSLALAMMLAHFAALSWHVAASPTDIAPTAVRRCADVEPLRSGTRRFWSALSSRCDGVDGHRHDAWECHGNARGCRDGVAPRYHAVRGCRAEFLPGRDRHTPRPPPRPGW